MSQWLGAAKLFEENSHSGSFFEAQSSIYALKQIHCIFNDTFPQMVFLLGEPGSGKSFLLNYLKKYYKEKKECLIVENPFLTPIEFLKRMLLFVDVIPQNDDVESLRIEAVKAYTGRDHIIMLDEAQLTHAPLREFIRILSDSKVFWFLIAMHTKEGEELLRSPHFYSRPHKVIYMGSLQSHECKPYLQKTFQGSELWDFVIGMGDKLIKKSYDYSKGNFRNFKKLYYHFFLLLDYANENNKKEFIKPNGKLLEMAAIKAGLTQTKKSSQDFDELALLVKQKSNKMALKVASALCALFFIGLGTWYLQTESFGNITNYKKSDKNGTTLFSNSSHTSEKNKLAKQSTQKTLIPKTKEINKTSEQNSLTFYPPNFDASKIKKENVPLVKNDDEQIVAEYKALIENEPNFLDDEIDLLQENEPIKRGPLLQLKSAKPKNITTLVKRFLNQPKYEDALKIAKIYYEKKDYKNASSWAKKANQLDKEKEDAWILFAKAQYARGNKQDAKSALRLFLDYKSSQKAKMLLNRWGG